MRVYLRLRRDTSMSEFRAIYEAGQVELPDLDVCRSTVR